MSICGKKIASIRDVDGNSTEELAEKLCFGGMVGLMVGAPDFSRGSTPSCPERSRRVRACAGVSTPEATCDFLRSLLNQ
jgi:hypothetical protein